MSSSSPSAMCIVCGQLLSVDRQECPSCGASALWQDFLRAIEFAQQQFEKWAGEQKLNGGSTTAIAHDFRQQHQEMCRMAREHLPPPAIVAKLSTTDCWNCRTPFSAAQTHCPGCSVPVEHPKAHRLRYWRYTGHCIKNYCDAGFLPLVQAHACMNEVKSCIATLRSELEKERRSEVVTAEVVEEKKASNSAASPRRSGDRPSLAAAAVDVETKPASKPRRSVLEMLLDPHTIQWLLGLGGVLFVLGLVIWLATLGVFKDPLIIAVALGIGNAVVLGGGGAMIRFSRYQTAGRAITLLACLVMPLNYGSITPMASPRWMDIFGRRRWFVACFIWQRHWCCATLGSSMCSAAESR